MKLFYSIIFLCVSNAHASFNDCKEHLGDAPIVPSNSVHEICYNGFAIHYNHKYNGPNYSVMVWNPANDVIVERSNWRKDSKLKSAPDYALFPDTRIFDKGHLTPADLAYNKETMYDLFYLTNQAPQYAECNRGNWKKIEQDVKKYIIRTGKPATIVTGVIYDGPPAPMNAPSIPTDYWKLVFAAEKTFAFVLSNDKEKCKVGVAPMSQSELMDVLRKNYFKNPTK